MKLFSFILAFLSPLQLASSHSGRTDSNGGQWERVAIKGKDWL